MSENNHENGEQFTEPVKSEKDTTPNKVEKKENTFTQSDLNAIVTKERREAVEAFLRESGIDENANYKERFNALKAWEDSQKTEIEKAQEQANTLAEEVERQRKNNEMLNRKLSALSKNIPSDKVDKYLKLAEAYPDVELSVALDMAIEEFPIEKPNSTVNFSAKTENQTNTNDSLINAIRKGRGKTNQRHLFTFKE